ncbi:protein of unknown function [Burkholderia multivorans]
MKPVRCQAISGNPVETGDIFSPVPPALRRRFAGGHVCQAGPGAYDHYRRHTSVHPYDPARVRDRQVADYPVVDV